MATRITKAQLEEKMQALISENESLNLENERLKNENEEIERARRKLGVEVECLESERGRLKADIVGLENDRNNFLTKLCEIDELYKKLKEKEASRSKAGRKPPSDNTIKRVKELREQGLSIRQIADRECMAIGKVHKIVKSV